MRAIHIIPVLLAFVIALTASFPAVAAGPPPEEAKKAAREGMKFHLNHKDTQLDINTLEQYSHYFGFESLADMDSAVLGEGFEIFTILPEKLLDESSIPQNLQSLVTSTNGWYFLIQGGGKPKALLDVSKFRGEWGTGAVRPSEIVKELSGLATWPASAGYQHRFIRAAQVSDFIELSQGGKVLGLFSLYSLRNTSGRAVGTFDPSDLLDPKDVLSNLRSSLKRNIESSKTGSPPSDDIKRAVWKWMKAKDNDEELRYLGFKTQDEIDSIEVGEGFEIFTIPLDKILDETAPQDMQSLATSTNRWIFLILAQGKPKTSVIIEPFDGEWTCGERGGSSFLDRFIEAWPASAGYRYLYIKVNQDDYMVVSKGGNTLGVVTTDLPVSPSTGEYMEKFNPRNLRDTKEVLSVLRSKVKRNKKIYK